MNEAVPQRTPEAVEPKTLVEGAYQRLRRDIIEGVHPPGEKLRVEHLKDRYEVGAGTLREALLLLVTDALVVAQGQRGFRVSPISIEDFEDITRTRLLLETEALRQSLQFGGEDWEAAIVAAAHRLSRRLRAGTVWVNCYDEGGDMSLPFGGYKQSGNGRDKSLHALEKYTELKTTLLKLG